MSGGTNMALSAVTSAEERSYLERDTPKEKSNQLFITVNTLHK